MSASDALVAFPDRDLAEGWLCFESDAEKRRLTPVPPEWEVCTEAELEELCARAGYVTTTPRDAMRGVP